MKFADALRIAQREVPAGARPLAMALVCGCTANHLQVFLVAHLRALCPDRHVRVETGLYGDCLGNLDRLSQGGAEGIAVVLEWSDFDPRLGIRQPGGWGPGDLPHILENINGQVSRFQDALVRAAKRVPVALCLPTLPLPAVAFTAGWQLSEFELELRGRLYTLASQVIRQPNLRLVNPERLDRIAAPAERRDVKSELLTGFPYRLVHASAVAELLSRLLVTPLPKKGLITDLDDTLWRGLVGEVGPGEVSWDLDHHSLIHALYQQLLRSLAETGALIAAASKNDPARVEEVFQREDLIVPPELLFPLEVHWGPKSESVQRILKIWNVGSDSVVFIDDDPLELAEVKAAHPGIETILFPKSQNQEVYELLGTLRDLFGKTSVREEDGLRLASVRRAAEHFELANLPQAKRDSFLQNLEAELALRTDKEPRDPRALELVNKTNQFNLNGRRYTEGEWQAYLKDPETFLFLVSYKDKFGPLGRIAVLAGRRANATLFVDTWVMSCRAFSRRIEYKCLEMLYDYYQVEKIAFDFEPTSRNGPLQEFFTALLDTRPAGGLWLSKTVFDKICPPLFHHVKVVSHV